MLSHPASLNETHDTAGFDCGIATLDEWLQERALRNQIEGASRTYVSCDGRRIAGYYALAIGSLSRSHATGAMRRNMPEPIPLMVLGRLAVDRSWQGKGLGTDMLADAVRRTLQAAQIAGIRGILVDAIGERAKSFYEHYGLRPSPADPMKLMVTLADVESALRQAG